jgi:pantoate--beta-alanine ligase
MRTVKKAKRMQSLAAGIKRDRRTIAFVPTMGALHEGHLSLIRKAKKLGDIVVVSIYVNRTQFGPGEDLQKYPRTLDRDKRLLRLLDVDCLFLPGDSEMYPSGYLTYVESEGITSILEGKSRPTHFRGVTTVVAKLFNIVQPDVAVFGQKDAQQAVVIKKMVADLNMPVKVIVAPTVREKTGLALSSRNRYLSSEQIRRASCIYQGLKRGRELVNSGVTDGKRVVSEIRRHIDAVEGTVVDYISINDANNLDHVGEITREVLISAAVELDGVRLIDNIRAKPGRTGR